MLFKILWSVDAIGTLVILYFFFVGLSDGTVGERNMGMWAAIVATCGVVLAGSYWLRTNQHPSLAVWVTLILALPAFAFLIFMLFTVGQKWN